MVFISVASSCVVSGGIVMMFAIHSEWANRVSAVVEDLMRN